MEMKQVESSNVAAVGYDEENEVLAVAFHSGRTYRYEAVPKSVYDNLLSADSVGRQFNATVRDQYAYS